MFVYFIGRYIRNHANNVKLRRHHFCMFLMLLQFIILLCNITLEKIFHKPCNVFAMDCSPLILASSVCIFYLFKSISLYSSLTNYIASGVLAVYLLDGLRGFVNNYINIQRFSGESSFLLWLSILVILTFCLSLAIEMIRRVIFGKIEQQILTGISKKNNLFSNRY